MLIYFMSFWHELLHVYAEVGVPNLGANLDIGHAFAALEASADSVTLLAHANRLFHSTPTTLPVMAATGI